MVCTSFTVSGGGGGGGTMVISSFTVVPSTYAAYPASSGWYQLQIIGSGSGTFRVTVDGVEKERRTGTFTETEIVHVQLLTAKTYQICAEVV